MFDEQPAYKVFPARHCVSGQVVIQPSSNGTGYKTPACHLASAMGRYSGRYRGYVMTTYRANLFMRLFADGWRGGVLGNFYSPDGKRFDNLREAKKHLKGLNDVNLRS